MSPGAAERLAWGALSAGHECSRLVWKLFAPPLLALRRTLIPEGEWRHAGKHQCSRCHARTGRGSLRTSSPPPSEGDHASAPPRIHEPKCSLATPWQAP